MFFYKTTRRYFTEYVINPHRRGNLEYDYEIVSKHII